MTKLLGAIVLKGQREEGEPIVDVQQGQGDGNKTKTVLSCESQERPGSPSFSVTPQGEAQQQVSPDRSTLCG